MVRSLNEIVFSIIELIRSNYKVTDSIDERLIAGWVQSARAELIKQKMSEPLRVPDEHWVQTLGKVQMTPVDSSIFSTGTGAIPSGKYMLRSTIQIPYTISSKGSIGCFTRIGPADRLGVRYNLVSKERALYSGNGKFNQNDVYAFLDNKYLYLISKTNLHKQIKYVEVKGVFENPIEAYTAAGITYTWDDEYPISDSLVDAIKNKIINENVRFILIPLDDKKPNSIDNLTTPTPEEEQVQNPLARR